MDWGIPESDHGSQDSSENSSRASNHSLCRTLNSIFRSRACKDVQMCSLQYMEKTQTTPYHHKSDHHKSDGMVNRSNMTLEALLSYVVNKNCTDWDKHMPYLMMAFRFAEHDITGYLPNKRSHYTIRSSVRYEYTKVLLTTQHC